MQPAGESFEGNGIYNTQKEGGLLDWYVEGPGRRVGYDDFTAIDWIFEYTKERQRKRLLSASGQGVVGYAHKLYDASNVWLVLVATGISVGIIAAFIDVVSDWLGDIKAGYCKNGPGGGKFYLNRSFCCWGHEQGKLPSIGSPISFLTRFLIKDPSNCVDWAPWGKAVGATSAGGAFAVEYIFYILYSVSASHTIPRSQPITNATARCFLPLVLVCWSGTMPYMQGTVESPK